MDTQTPDIFSAGTKYTGLIPGIVPRFCLVHFSFILSSYFSPDALWGTYPVGITYHRPSHLLVFSKIPFFWGGGDHPGFPICKQHFNVIPTQGWIRASPQKIPLLSPKMLWTWHKTPLAGPCRREAHTNTQFAFWIPIRL